MTEPGDRQRKYRQRCRDEGIERVELLLPNKDAAAWVKAYARAVKIAVDLGQPIPRFSGMTADATTTNDALSSQKVKSASAAITRARQASVVDQATDALLQKITSRRQAEQDVGDSRPDFSTGLFG
jgi:hypothetical protein